MYPLSLTAGASVEQDEESGVERLLAGDDRQNISVTTT